MMTVGDDLRRWADVRDGYWFAPKLFGYGATPVTWQGWLVTLLGVGAALAAVMWLPGDGAKTIGAVVAIGALVIIAYAKTDGGWRWRWGPDR